MSLNNTQTITINGAAKTFKAYKEFTSAKNRWGRVFNGMYDATNRATLRTTVEEGKGRRFASNSKLATTLTFADPLNPSRYITDDASCSFTLRVPSSGSTVEVKALAKAQIAWLSANTDAILDELLDRQS